VRWYNIKGGDNYSLHPDVLPSQLNCYKQLGAYINPYRTNVENRVSS